MEKKEYLLAERSDLTGFTQFSIFYKVYNKSGGSVSTPLGRIEIREKPSSDGVNPHIELRVIIRNDVRFKWGAIHIVNSPKKLNRVRKVIPDKELQLLLSDLIQKESISEPYTIYETVENVEDYKTYGNIYRND